MSMVPDGQLAYHRDVDHRGWITLLEIAMPYAAGTIPKSTKHPVLNSHSS
jgi:hypothetical protein